MTMRRPASSLVSIVLACVSLVGCTGDATGPEGALEQALGRARPDPEGAREAGRSEATRKTARLELTFAATASQTLVIEQRVDEDGAGRFRIHDARTLTAPSAADPSVQEERRDDVEIVFDGAALALRHGEGPWIERDVLDGLPDRKLARGSEPGRFVMAAFGDYLQYQEIARAIAASPSGTRRPDTVGGRRATWATVTLDPAVRPRALPEAERVALRDHDPSVPLWVAATHRPTRVTGEIARADDGAMLAGWLRIEGETALPDGSARFEVALTIEVAPLPPDVSFELPADRLPESRERPWLMIEDVLGQGLLAPYRRD